MKPTLQPMDIVVIDGLWYMPAHPPIMWRGLDPAVHCLTLSGESGVGWSPEFSGIKMRSIDDYKGRRLTIHRYREPFKRGKVLSWCFETSQSCEGYDFTQWVMGFVLGITARKIADDPRRYTCAEFPYAAFTRSGYQLTPRPEILPMPRLFRFNPLFDTIFEGEWQ